jgi:hypothetical protein
MSPNPSRKIKELFIVYAVMKGKNIKITFLKHYTMQCSSNKME